ncbi:MAG: hypothetical protein WDM80_05025 [Limisphaerales bacterium]
MKKHLASIGFMAIALCGCMHTVEGGSDSPAKHYSLWLNSHGASGKAYVDKTKKKIWISIGKRGSTDSEVLFQQRYILTGSDIEWKISWDSDRTVSVEFYDWGDGVSNYDNMKHMTASNHIAQISFIFDQTTGKFSEQK